MIEKVKEKKYEIKLEDLESFGKGIKYVSKSMGSSLDVGTLIPSGKEFIMNRQRTFLIVPKQEIPESWKERYPKLNGDKINIDSLKEILDFFEDSPVQIRMSNESGPIVIESDDLMVFLGPIVEE